MTRTTMPRGEYRSPAVEEAERTGEGVGHYGTFIDPETGQTYQRNEETGRLEPQGRYVNTSNGQEHVAQAINDRENAARIAEANSIADDVYDWNPDVDVHHENVSDPRLFDLGVARQHAKSSETTRLAQQEALESLLAGTDSAMTRAEGQGLNMAQNQAAMGQRRGLQAAGGDLASQLEALSYGNTSPYAQANRAASQRAMRSLQGYGDLASQMRSAGFDESAYRANAVDEYNRNNVGFLRDAAARNVNRTNRARDVGSENRRWKNFERDRNTQSLVDRHRHASGRAIQDARSEHEASRARAQGTFRAAGGAAQAVSTATEDEDR